MTTGSATSSRPYGGDNDLALMREFLSAAAAASPPQAYYHPGDLSWNLYRNPELDPRSEVRLWQDRGGNLLGFAWLEEPDGVVMQVRPDLRGTGILEEPILAWASERLADPGRNPGGEIWTRALETDRRLADLLGSLGFERDPFHALKMHRGLGDPMPEAPSPTGWSVREVDGEGEWEDRVEIHREVWQSSRMSLGAYRRLREAPGYMAELDLVAVGPGGARVLLQLLARRGEQDRTLRARRYPSCPSRQGTRQNRDARGSPEAACAGGEKRPRERPARQRGRLRVVRVGGFPYCR